MSTMTHSVLPARESRRSFPIRIASVLLFWAVAVAAVIGVHASMDRISTAASAAVEIAAIVVMAWLYVRLTAPRCTVDHALLVGLAWLVMSIAVEIATSSRLGHGWFDLIGSPARPAIRDLLMFTWVAAPALFARFDSNGPRG